MLKTELAAHCLRILEEKVAAIKSDLDELSKDVQGESKSSAGDKHETARAMMNIEQEKLGRQLEEVLQMKDVFQKIDFNKESETIIPGSLIKTDNGNFLLSIALGKIIFNNEAYILLSPQSPLGERLLGKHKGELILMNGKTFKVMKLA
jgi:transcription elongation GreA/GreB family factor